MDASGYVTLTRLSGLRREMDLVANNIANSGTLGFKSQGAVFSEFIADLDGGSSLSMARASAWAMNLDDGVLSQTGGTFDLAIQGNGFFQIESPEGPRLTRAGNFTPSPAGELVTPDGQRLLDAGGAPVFVPPGAQTIAIAQDGTISADGVPVGQIGLWQPVDPLSLRYAGGNLMSTPEVEPATGSTLHQGFVEESNVQPVTEIARMIEVQRAYEMGQSFLDAEDERMKNLIQVMGR
ncbi:MAG: flagellar hook-basal body complex protein [Paracoccaceae bacterium]